MKYIIFFLLFSLSLNAQTVVTDSIYQSGQSIVNTIVYDDGREVTTKTPLSSGFDGSLIANYNTALSLETQRMVSTSSVATGFAKRLRDLSTRNTSILAITGVSPLDTVANALKNDFVGTYTITNGTTETLTISINNQGKVKWAQGATNGLVIIYSKDVIVLKNYSGTTDVPFYSIRKNVYKTVDGSIKLTKQ